MDIDDIIQLPTHQIYDLMPMDFDRDEDPLVADDAEAVPTIALPSHFIFVKHHTHAHKCNEIISLDGVQSFTPLSKDDSHPAPLPDARPWAPFKTYSDYKFTSHCVQRRTPNTAIDEDLHDLHAHAFSSDCFITFRNHRDMEKSLAAARMSNISFRCKTLRIDFEGAEFGGVYEVEIEFRDPWQIMKQWVTDETLTPPDNLRQIDPNMLTGSTRSEYDRLKCLIYRGVCHLVMASLEQWSHHGEALRFSDGVTRIAYLGVLIESMDFEELAAWLAIQNLRSLHPCPQCLVHKNDLPRLTKTFPERTTESTSLALARAPAGKTNRNEHLKQYGLHDFDHFLWKFNNSDPYPATGYDCLHFFDGGIWGQHMWPLIKGYLQNNGLASKFNANMANFPRWRDLKHISSPTTIDYSDGQTFLDILKAFNSWLVRLIRIMNKVRALLGVEVATDTRLELLHKFIAEYEKICKGVSQTYNKLLDFLKQHFLSHVIGCFKDKGTSQNQNTHVGEGFQQEIAAQYQKTNGKDAEHQMSIMDENEETMARLDMKVNEWRKSQEEDEADPVLPANATTAHWRLGSADARMSSIHLETLYRGNPLFRDFNMHLREYLAGHHPRHPVYDDQDIQASFNR
ncbi:hypothetical protein B0H10DRAFT_2206633 [Mycena sp. CBHHK59/15]|nr:hypothetical protein B0H10DRAFT_2206633 [Mycena sp. CBHHK59/15]